MCSGCFSLERHRLLIDYIECELPAMLNDSCQILHLAAEACVSWRVRQNANATYVTADNMSQFIDGLEEAPDHVMDITDLNFEDETFDYVICYHVLEHVPDDQQGMGELYRVLKQGGVGLINVPLRRESSQTLEDTTLNDEQRALQYGAADHLRYYGVDDFKSRLERAGFTVMVRDYGRETELDEVKNGIMTHEKIVVSTKA
ncbi:MAG: methyltransferase domain-containing protein [Planctomycetota bacterium]